MDFNIPNKYLHHTVGISAAVSAVERRKSFLKIPLCGIQRQMLRGAEVFNEMSTEWKNGSSHRHDKF